MRSTLIMDPTVGTFAGFIVEPIDVVTMDIHITMGGIIDAIPMEDTIIPTAVGDIIDPIPMEDIIVHTNFEPYRRRVRRAGPKSRCCGFTAALPIGPAKGCPANCLWGPIFA